MTDMLRRVGLPAKTRFDQCKQLRTGKINVHFDPRKKNFPMIYNNTKSEERIGRYGL